MFFKKATQKNKVKILSIFVAFLENTNFTLLMLNVESNFVFDTKIVATDL